jgi:hypothetical protein
MDEEVLINFYVVASRAFAFRGEAISKLMRRLLRAGEHRPRNDGIRKTYAK